MKPIACASCRQCCTHQTVLLLIEDEPRMAHYQVDAHDFEDKIFFTLQVKENGDCIHLGPAGCTIYENRPEVCRAYDCRIQFLIMPEEDRRLLTNQAIWEAALLRMGTLSMDDFPAVKAYMEMATKTFARVLLKDIAPNP